MSQSPLKNKIIDIVNRIPTGKVAAYGQVAEIVQAELGQRTTAQLVGRQLSGMKRTERELLPWWRVVNKKGEISTLKLGEK
jgi:alkylated DNA nucleotide flippase Atl1